MKTIDDFFEGRSFATKQEKFLAMKEHKKAILKAKCSTEKRWVTVPFVGTSFETSYKADGDSQVLTPKVAINCCNLMDEHEDVHIAGNYTKSVKEQGAGFPFLQEHVLSFKNIIDDPVRGAVETINWQDLGAPYEGKTETFVMYPNITKSRNAFMFSEYSKGHVKQHSIGMRYVWPKIYMAINSEYEELAEEKENWDKYRPLIVNGEKADELGYFFAVTEIKILEGSAVPRGSNMYTPTMEAGKSTSNHEPSKDTQTTELLNKIENQVKCLNSMNN